MDRGYLDFARLYRLHASGAFFVTRAKKNLECQAALLASDRRDHRRASAIRPSRLTGFNSGEGYPEHLRRIRFNDPETEQATGVPHQQLRLAGTDDRRAVQGRWQVELFFKWIKQHLRIKAFFGTSENAVKTQIWIAVVVYVLVAIVKKRLAPGGLASTECYRS